MSTFHDWCFAFYTGAAKPSTGKDFRRMIINFNSASLQQPMKKHSALYRQLYRKRNNENNPYGGIWMRYFQWHDRTVSSSKRDCSRDVDNSNTNNQLEEVS
jgi:hypothetical protein